jgi:hypothetical protein
MVLNLLDSRYWLILHRICQPEKVLENIPHGVAGIDSPYHIGMVTYSNNARSEFSC